MLRRKIVMPVLFLGKFNRKWRGASNEMLAYRLSSIFVTSLNDLEDTMKWRSERQVPCLPSSFQRRFEGFGASSRVDGSWHCEHAEEKRKEIDSKLNKHLVFLHWQLLDGRRQEASRVERFLCNTFIKHVRREKSSGHYWSEKILSARFDRLTSHPWSSFALFSSEDRTQTLYTLSWSRSSSERETPMLVGWRHSSNQITPLTWIDANSFLKFHQRNVNLPLGKRIGEFSRRHYDSSISFIFLYHIIHFHRVFQSQREVCR